jgi:DNA primase
MDAASEIKDKLNIEDVVGEYVQLKRSGRNYKGLSPFGNEKTPSFMVSPDKGIWHDFSSGKGGSIFGFIMEMEGVDFRGALEILARKAGVELKSFQGNNSKKKDEGLSALSLAKNFYQHCLINSPETLAYVKKRGISRQTLIDFGIGYSPSGGQALTDYLLNKSVSAQTLQDVGLATRRYDKPFDMFRGRLLIPLSDALGQTVGFTARQLDNNPDSPKYINTPATHLYDKGRQVFGLFQAKEAIRKSGFVVVVEGNLDVTSSHQIDVKNVVAAAGTAFTTNHLKSLARYSGDIRICFDSDSAGQNATERAVLMSIETQIKLSVIILPDSAKDPDELIQTSPEAWANAINNSVVYGIDWLINKYATPQDLDSANGKKQFSTLALKAISGLEDAVEKEHYQKVVAERLGTSLTAVLQKSDKQAQTGMKRLKKPVEQTAEHSDSELSQEDAFFDRFLSIVMTDTTLRDDLLKDMDQETFGIGNATDATLKYLRAHPDKQISAENLPKDLHDYETYVKILLFQYELRYKQLSTDERREEAFALQKRILKTVKEQQKNVLIDSLRAAERAKDQNKVAQILKQIQQSIDK